MRSESLRVVNKVTAQKFWGNIRGKLLREIRRQLLQTKPTAEKSLDLQRI